MSENVLYFWSSCAVRLDKGYHIPEIMAKSASTTAHMPWLTTFQEISASVFCVVTAMRRIIDAMQTLFWSTSEPRYAIVRDGILTSLPKGTPR